MAQNNKHKQGEQETKEQRVHQRLNRLYASQPFHERNYYLHLIAYIFGWFGNLVSGITEASRIYAFFFGILGSVLYGNEASWTITVICILLFEIIHRLLAQSYFREYVQNEGHDRSMNKSLVAMVAVGLFLTALSFSGGFDLIRLTSSKPDAVIAEQYEISDFEGVLQPLVGKAQEDAETFRKSKLWRGKLSDKNTKRYNELLDAAKEQETVLAQSITSLPERNLKLQAQADSINQNRLHSYELSVSNRGYGLGGITILAILVMYVCVYFSELYRLKYKDYLDKKYGTIEPDQLDNSPKRVHSANDLDEKVQQAVQQMLQKTQIQQVQQNTLLQQEQRVHSNEKGELNGTEVQNQVRSPIGFHRNREKRVHRKEDMYTIQHQYRKDGKTVTTHYTLPTIRARVAQYERKIAALDGSDKQRAVQNATKRYQYWQQQEQKLTAKLRRNGLLDEVLQTVE